MTIDETAFPTSVDGFHPDPLRSYTLPGHYYHDPDIFRREQEAIFHRSWQLLDHVGAATAPGSYITRDIGDQSIMVVRGEDGEARGFYNVCQHRAHRLVEGDGDIRGAITCPYHAWVYDFDGRLRSPRGAENIHGFSPDEFSLKPVQVEAFCGFLFTNLDPDGPSLGGQATGLDNEFRSRLPDPEKLKLAHRRKYDVAANWKIVMENYSECYHCPTAHRDFVSTMVDIATYRITLHDIHHSHLSTPRQAHDEAPSRESETARRGKALGGWFLWPNVAFEVYPEDSVMVFHVVPLAPDRTRLVIDWYLTDETPDPLQQSVIDHLHATVRTEDVALVESVQKGLQSKGYGQGRFMVDAERTNISEHAVHHFQGMVLQALAQ